MHVSWILLECKTEFNDENRNIEQIELQNQEYTISMQQNGRSSVPPPSLDIIRILSTDISGLLHVLSSKMEEFTDILKNPKDVVFTYLIHMN